MPPGTKKKIKDSILEQVYTDKNKVKGLSFPNASVGNLEYIYQQYLKAFKKGVFNYIKEEPDTLTQTSIPRKYFSGGADCTRLNAAMSTIHHLDAVPGNQDHLVIVSSRFDAAMRSSGQKEGNLDPRQLINKINGLITKAPKLQSLKDFRFDDKDVKDLTIWLLTGRLFPKQALLSKLWINITMQFISGSKDFAEEWLKILDSKWNIPKLKLKLLMQWLIYNKIPIKGVAVDNLQGFLKAFVTSQRLCPHLKPTFMYGLPPNIDPDQKINLARMNMERMMQMSSPDFIENNLVLKAPIEGTKYFIGIRFGLAESTYGLYLVLGEEDNDPNPFNGTFLTLGLDTQGKDLRIVMMKGVVGKQKEINDDFPKELGLHPGLALMYVALGLAEQGDLRFDHNGIDMVKERFENLMGVKPEYNPMMDIGEPTIDLMINYEKFGLRRKTDFARWQSIDHLMNVLIPQRLNPKESDFKAVKQAEGIKKMMEAFHHLREEIVRQELREKHVTVDAEDITNNQLMAEFFDKNKDALTVPVYLYPIKEGELVQRDRFPLEKVKEELKERLIALKDPDGEIHLYWKLGERNKWAIEAKEEVDQELEVPPERSDWISFEKKVRRQVGEKLYDIWVQKGKVMFGQLNKRGTSYKAIKDLDLKDFYEDGECRLWVVPIDKGYYRLYYRSRTQTTILKWRAVPDPSHNLGIFMTAKGAKRIFGSTVDELGLSTLVNGDGPAFKEAYNIIRNNLTFQPDVWNREKAYKRNQEVEEFLKKAARKGNDFLKEYKVAHENSLETILNFNLAAAWEDQEGRQSVTIVHNGINLIYVLKKDSNELIRLEDGKDLGDGIYSTVIRVEEGDSIFMTTGMPTLKIEDLFSANGLIRNDTPEGMANEVLGKIANSPDSNKNVGVVVLRVIDDYTLQMHRLEKHNIEMDAEISTLKFFKEKLPNYHDVEVNAQFNDAADDQKQERNFYITFKDEHATSISVHVKLIGHTIALLDVRKGEKLFYDNKIMKDLLLAIKHSEQKTAMFVLPVLDETLSFYVKFFNDHGTDFKVVNIKGVNNIRVSMTPSFWSNLSNAAMATKSPKLRTIHNDQAMSGINANIEDIRKIAEDGFKSWRRDVKAFSYKAVIDHPESFGGVGSERYREAVNFFNSTMKEAQENYEGFRSDIFIATQVVQKNRNVFKKVTNQEIIKALRHIFYALTPAAKGQDNFEYAFVEEALIFELNYFAHIRGGSESNRRILMHSLSQGGIDSKLDTLVGRAIDQIKKWIKSSELISLAACRTVILHPLFFGGENSKTYKEAVIKLDKFLSKGKIKNLREAELLLGLADVVYSNWDKLTLTKKKFGAKGKDRDLWIKNLANKIWRVGVKAIDNSKGKKKYDTNLDLFKPIFAAWVYEHLADFPWLSIKSAPLAPDLAMTTQVEKNAGRIERLNMYILLNLYPQQQYDPVVRKSYNILVGFLNFLRKHKDLADESLRNVLDGIAARQFGLSKQLRRFRDEMPRERKSI